MAQWADTITLISIVQPTERVNANGIPNKPTEKKRIVFFNKKNIGYAEYYASAQAGKTASLKGEVHTVDYNGETLAEFNFKRYKIERTYEINDEVVELTLTDLSEKV